MIVTVYSASEDCPISWEVRQWLEDYQIEFEEYFPFPELLEHMAATYGYAEFPHIWVDDEFIGGCPELLEMFNQECKEENGDWHL